MQKILIIGAGFCGAVTAVQLIAEAGTAPVSVILLNRSGRMARGLAYGTRSQNHTLNVPAGNMSALVDEPDHFLRFSQSRDSTICPSFFVSRKIYGDYLENLLDTAEHARSANASLERIAGEVSELSMLPSGEGSKVKLVDGRCFEVDKVVLAFGHFPSNEPYISDRNFYGSNRYVRDPWDANAVDSIDPEAPVLLLGSGLTAVDVAATLLDRSANRRIHIISRRGLHPKTHRVAQAPPSRFGLPTEFVSASSSLRAQFRAFRRHASVVAAAGEDWREALNALRPQTHRLWQAYSEADKRRFLRHVQPYWDNHRHRAAPATHQRFEGAIETGAINVLAGRIVDFDEDADGVMVRLRQRGIDEQTSLRVKHVINCIGPSSDLRTVDNRLVRQLLADGLIRTDPLCLGLDVGDNCAVIDAQGKQSAKLFYVGPLLKAKYWEATAVPELRRFAAELAKTLLESD